MFKYYRLIFCLLALGFIGCSANKTRLRDHKGTYLENVKLNYDAGLAALKNGDYDKAISYFQFVKSKYAFSQYAALSDLKIADVKYVQEKWLEAASAYEIFIRLHPRHEDVPYAAYRMGASYFYAIPKDFFILPGSHTRDQTYTKEALQALERFILQYPESEYLEDAKKKRDELFSKLAKNNQHVAEYYISRGKYEAAVQRYLRIHELYPNIKEAHEALYSAALILYKNIKDNKRSAQVLQMLLLQSADKSLEEKAQKLLKELETGPQD
jgi:outer membrane protein assembly factor BamD